MWEKSEDEDGPVGCAVCADPHWRRRDTAVKIYLKVALRKRYEQLEVHLSTGTRGDRQRLRLARRHMQRAGLIDMFRQYIYFTPGSFIEVSLSQSSRDEISDIISIILRFSQ